MYHYTIIQWLFFFYFYCFFGWCFESAYVSLKKRCFVNRGFMRGPFLPLYGSGAIMMLVVSMPFQDHLLLTFLFNFGGNIGYSVRPSERQKGYASEMLRLILPICREFGKSKVLLTCDKKNEASQKTIVKNGGVLEKEIPDTVGLSESGIIQRYWISI